MINLDRCFSRGKQFLYGVLDLVDKLNMFDEIILKAPTSPIVLDWIESYPKKVMFMPIVTNIQGIEEVMKRSLNTIGFELVFNKDQSPIIDQSLLKQWKQKGYALWVNALSIDERYPLAANHDDTCSLTQSIN